MAQTVVFDDLQAGQGLVLQGVGDALPGDDGGGVGLGIPLPPLRGGQLNNLISSGFQLCEGVGTAGVGGAGVDGAALDVLDLYLGPGQTGAGGSVNLLDAEVAIGLI